MTDKFIEMKMMKIVWENFSGYPVYGALPSD